MANKVACLVPKGVSNARALSLEAVLGVHRRGGDAARPRVRRAVRNLIVQDMTAPDAPAPRLGAIDEIWFDRTEDAEAFVATGPGDRWRIPVEEQILIDSPPGAAAAKLIALAYPASGLSRGDSRRYFLDHHFPLSKQLGLDGGFMRFVQNWVAPEWQVDDPGKAFVGMLTASFRTQEDMAAAWADQAKIEQIEQDERRFIIRETAVRAFVEEYPIVLG